MNLTSDEKKMFEWAKREHNSKNQDSIFSKPDAFRESYYEKHDDNGLVYEYGFETYAELRTQLDALWSDETDMYECIRISSVAAMKYKPMADASTADCIGTLQNELYEIPEYVYVF